MQQNSPRKVVRGGDASYLAPRTDPYVRLSRIRLPPRASTASRCRRRFAATVASGHATLALLPAYVRLQRNDHHNFRLVIRQKCGSIL